MRSASLLQLLLAASLTVLPTVLAQRKCYLPNGDLAPNDKPCLSTSNHVFCCPTGYSCQGSPGPACSANDTLIRPSCTDSTFNSVNCPHYCIARQFADQVDIERCSTDLRGEMCCGYDARRDLCSCSPRNNTFSLGTYELVTKSSAAASKSTAASTKTKTAKTTSSTLGMDTGPPAPSTSSDESSGLSVGARVGIGVAVPVAVLGVAAVAALAIMRRRRRAREQKPSGEAEVRAYDKPELDAETTARTRDELVKPSFELPGSPPKNQSPVELDSRMLPTEMGSQRSPTTPK